jgi:hypothetical protein
MASEEQQLQPPSSESLAAGYEKSSISIKGLMLFLVCFVIAAALIHLGSWYLFRAYVSEDRKNGRPTSALADPAMANRYGGTVLLQPQPPPPYIQPSPPQPEPHIPVADLRQMYTQENLLFERMGWRPDEASPQKLAIPPDVIAKVIEDEAAAHKRSSDQH